LLHSDLTFITNEQDASLLDRFNVLVKDCRAFDVLVGYFFASGFHALYKSLEGTESIRILVGISTNRSVLDAVSYARHSGQLAMDFSHYEVKESIEPVVVSEFEESEDNQTVEEGICKFIEWLKSGKLQIKAYPTQNIHAKVYIMTFAEGDRDAGRVITGSSNFTQAGLIDNLEFNVELKNRADYEFALGKFNDLWESAVDINEKYLDVIRTKTWLNDAITPYQLYLKLLYEYFRDELNQSDELFFRYTPENFRKLEYQEQAVLSAKRVLEEYGGVFISDVVGLGKTYISALLANQLDGRHLVLAPPALLDRANPGSWPNVFGDFKVSATFESLGKLDKILAEGVERYDNVFIDEAHRFRNENNVTYESLARICRGKRVILVTATPYNNYPRDILSQIRLFQGSKKSSIPNLSNLEAFFSRLEKRTRDLDRQLDYDEYMWTVKDNAKQIREKVLKYLMVRRTRSEIIQYFGEDLKKQNLRFPDVADPEPVYYELNDEEDAIFEETIRCVASGLTYARYKPKTYLKQGIAHSDQLSQTNMASLMKVLLVKRLESSVYAFRRSIDRFIASYEQVLSELEGGRLYVSKRYSDKIFEMLENDEEEAIQRLIDEDKAEAFDGADFIPEFETHLRDDLRTLHHIRDLWSKITRDAKLLAFKKKLESTGVLKNNKLLVFTESKETAEYLLSELSEVYPEKVIAFTGGSSAAERATVIYNFDARARHPEDDYRILVATEVLSEGVNLHRSNVVINYDIPWNPTRMMQRVGRVNRVDTPFDTIYTYNFFPTKQSNDEIKLKESAEAKIHAFISMLGADARLLLEGEVIESHELFNRLTSKQAIEGSEEGEETELKYLQVIRDLRENDPDLFDAIKRLPKKARTARPRAGYDCALTYFRRGKLQKFFLAGADDKAAELDFMAAASMLEASPDTPKEALGRGFYTMLDRNKEAFRDATDEELAEPTLQPGSRSNIVKLLSILKALKKDTRKLTDDQEHFVQTLQARLESGSIPKQTAKKALEAVQKELANSADIVKLVGVIRKSIPPQLLESFASEKTSYTSKPREVILSEYFRGEPNG
jgi:superfamily II DNA or RNA helicase/HKD family nuclease